MDSAAIHQINNVDRVRSDRYYFSEGDTWFMVSICCPEDLFITTYKRLVQVENCVYKLHSSVLTRRLEVFEPLSLLQAGQGGTLDGKDEAHPICPPQVTKKEWEYLLTLIYDRYVAADISRAMQMTSPSC